MESSKNLRLLGALFFLSLLFSIPSMLLIPRYLPFLDAEVRIAAPQAIAELRSRGLWIINMEMLKVEKQDKQICFTWEHQYRKRNGFLPPEILTTCIDESSF